MALIKCAECATEMSDQAGACPKCGAKPKAKTSPLTWVIGAIVLVVVYQVASNSAISTPPSGPVEKTTAEKQADAEFQTAIKMGRLIKKTVKYPSSFDMESFVVYPGGAACYEYRSKNSFGDIVVARAVYDGEALLLNELNGAKFVKSWNAICTLPGGEERGGGLNLLGVW